MKRSIPITVYISMLVGLAGLARFARDVRAVDALGLFVCGAAFGIGCLRVGLGLTGRLDDRDKR